MKRLVPVMLRDLFRFLFVPGARLVEVEEEDFASRLDSSLAERRAKRAARQAAARKGWDTRRSKDRKRA